MEVCKALLDSTNKRCYCAKINESEIAVTTTGFDVFIFDISECVFDISKIKQHDILSAVCDDHEKDIKISKTKELFADGDHIVEKYTGENLYIYVNREVSKKFNGSGINFFAHSPRERILVKDMLGRKVGAFLPVRFDEKEI